jgi:hypothetical protein
MLRFDGVLPNLTAEDLDLGVGIVGHRRKLLAALVVPRADTEAKTAPTSFATAAEAPGRSAAISPSWSAIW